MTEQQKAITTTATITITITITITNLRSRRAAQKARKNPQHKQKPQNHHTAAKDTKSTPYVELALN